MAETCGTKVVGWSGATRARGTFTRGLIPTGFPGLGPRHASWLAKGLLGALGLVLVASIWGNANYTLSLLTPGSFDREINTHSISPPHGLESTCPIPALQNFSQFYSAITRLEMKCHKKKGFGTRRSYRIICLDERFQTEPKKCVVFSFGIDNDFSFEDDLGKFGCKVFAYDPTMGVKDHQRSENVSFIAKGISNYDGEKLVGMDNKWSMEKVDRLENLVAAAGMAGHPIDVVKLDVELSELDFLQDMLFNSRLQLTNIKQLAMEIHSDLSNKDVSPTSSHQIFWPYLNLLRCAGFKLISSRNAGKWREVVWAQDKQW